MKKRIFLLPGEWVVSPPESEITTVLGSCVAVAIWDAKNQVSGLNHYLLPTDNPDQKPNPRYAKDALELLVQALLDQGAQLRNLKAKVYGGANVLANVEIGKAIGEGNIETALRYLEDMNIPITEMNVGGRSARKITLDTTTFEVVHVS